MASLLSQIGIRSASLQNGLDGSVHHAGGYLIFNFLWAYILTSTRGWKTRYGLDHNVAPREDLDKYGEKAVRDGKLSPQILARLRRNEAAHANAVENYTLFVGAVLFALHTQVSPSTLNTTCALYSIARVLYTFAYIFVEKQSLSWGRTILFWTGNICCLSLLWKGSNNI